MKSLFFKTVGLLIMFLFSNYSLAAITRYENSNTSNYIYGSYEFDDVSNIFLNVKLKVNFSELGGPGDIDMVSNTDTSDAGLFFVSSEDFDSMSTDNQTLFRYVSGALFEKTNPTYLQIINYGRWDIYVNGFGSDFITPINLQDPFNMTTVHFTASPVLSVPEPESATLVLAGLGYLAFSVQRRRRIS
jgi:hypothetical protein